MIIKERRLERMKKLFSLIIISIMFMQLVVAGVGIKWDQESALVSEKGDTCLSYQVYNPWETESYVKIEVSEVLKEVLVMQEAEAKLIPENTASTEAIPVEFCFEIPKVYETDCWLADKFICKKDCNEEQKIYSGEVIVKSVPPPAGISGTGGSVASMAVSAPLKLKIKCDAYTRNFTLIYVVVGIISLLIVGALLHRKYRKPKIQRDKEKLKKLKDTIKKERNK